MEGSRKKRNGKKRKRTDNKDDKMQKKKEIIHEYEAAVKYRAEARIGKGRKESKENYKR